MLCMMSMLNHWLKRESDKQPVPTWKALCLGLTDVDRAIVKEIEQRRHISGSEGTLITGIYIQHVLFLFLQNAIAFKLIHRY